MGLLQTVRYFSCRQNLAANTAVNETFYKGAGTASGEFNDLGADGILPDNAEGELTAIVLRNSAAMHISDITVNRPRCVLWSEIINKCIVKLSIAGVTVWDSPVWACAGPPEWFQGAEVVTGTTILCNVQNGGYMMQSLKHPIHQRAAIIGTLTSATALGAAPQANIDFATMSLQVITRQAIAG